MNRYNASPIVMGQTPSKGLVMAKRQVASKTCAIWGRMLPYVIWEQSWNNSGNPFAKFSGWKQSQTCLKKSQNDHLLINVACGGLPIWTNQEKVWSLGLAHSFRRKVGSSHLIQVVMRWELRWC